MLSCSMFETEILKSIIKPRVMKLRLQINKRTSFNLLEPTCIHVKIYDCLLELQKQIGVCLSF